MERVDTLDIPCSIIRNHHENWDSSGYLDRLHGKNIPLGARIVAVADLWDAITAMRCHTCAGVAQASGRLVDQFLAKRLWS